ncbi:MAG TPA: hypothetical protein PLB25_13125 [Rhodoferax sp.]|nr:hypothetical protein [Rhodoferax sp.]
MNSEPSEQSQKSVSARRRLFQILAVGGTAAVVLPTKWVKPVVDAVIVPAHAAGSVVRVSGIYGNSGGVLLGSASVLDRFTGMLMSSAQANNIQSCANTVCISFDIPANGNTVQIWALNVPGTTNIQANNTLDNVTVGQLAFSGMYADSVYLRGTITATPNALCSSGTFTFPRVSAACNSAPT